MIATLALAVNLSFGVTFTHHVGLDGDFEAVHPFVEASVETSMEGLDVGLRLFRNSYGDPALLLGLEYREQGSQFSVSGGLALGYDEAPLMPFARASWHLGDHHELFIGPVPKDASGTSWGALLGLEITF